jgi:hypothetical protein
VQVPGGQQVQGLGRTETSTTTREGMLGLVDVMIEGDGIYACICNVLTFVCYMEMHTRAPTFAYTHGP